MCMCVCVCVYVYVYSRVLLSHKKEGNSAICSNMDGPREYYAREISQTEKDKYCMTSLTCAI